MHALIGCYLGFWGWEYRLYEFDLTMKQRKSRKS